MKLSFAISTLLATFAVAQSSQQAPWRILLANDNIDTSRQRNVFLEETPINDLFGVGAKAVNRALLRRGTSCQIFSDAGKTQLVAELTELDVNVVFPTVDLTDGVFFCV